MKIKSTVTLTIELDGTVAQKLVSALSHALEGASIGMINDGSVDTLVALRDGLRRELAVWQE